MTDPKEWFELLSLVLSCVIIGGWLLVFRKWWMRMLLHMGVTYTYLLFTVLISGALLRVIRAMTFLGFVGDTWWYMLFGIWATASIWLIGLFLHRSKDA